MALARDDDRQESSHELLQWSVDRSEDTVVVSLIGEVDLSSAGALSALLEGIVAERPPNVAVDVSGVSFLDSSGIKCLMDVAMSASTTGCTLVVRSPTTAIEHVFAICGVDDFLLDRSGGNGSGDR
jgi:anti-sigma B factor antagonist